MNFFSRLLNRKKQNPYYLKLHKSIVRKGISINIKSAYFLFGIPYTTSSVEDLKRSIAENKLKECKEKTPYDVQVDNIELYLVKDPGDNLYIIFLLDPHELYEGEEILDVVPVESWDFEKEIIFP